MFIEKEKRSRNLRKLKLSDSPGNACQIDLY
jgi:hypothetical protein